MARAKILGSGFSIPSVPEMRIASKSGAIPIDSIFRVCQCVGPFVIIPTFRPRVRRVFNVARVSGERWQDFGKVGTEVRLKPVCDRARESEVFCEDMMQLRGAIMAMGVQCDQPFNKHGLRHIAQIPAKGLELGVRYLQDGCIPVIKRAVQIEKDCLNQAGVPRSLAFHSSAVIAHLS